MAEAIIRQCSSCKTQSPASIYQDKEYGKGNRVHNPCSNKSGVEYRCTVCGGKVK